MSLLIKVAVERHKINVSIENTFIYSKQMRPAACHTRGVGVPQCNGAPLDVKYTKLGTQPSGVKFQKPIKTPACHTEAGVRVGSLASLSIKYTKLVNSQSGGKYPN